jgi:hypothetical protein
VRNGHANVWSASVLLLFEESPISRVSHFSAFVKQRKYEADFTFVLWRDGDELK